MTVAKQMKQDFFKIKNLWWGLNAGRSPPHPPSKEVAIPDAHEKGLKN